MLRVVVVVRSEDLVLGIQVVVNPAKDRPIPDCMVYSRAIRLVEGRLHKVHQRHSLAIRRSQDGAICRRSPIESDVGGTGRAQGSAQIVACQVFSNPLSRGEKKQLLPGDGAANAAAELIAAEILQRLAIRSVGG